MPKYLFKASYTADGVKGVLKEGGSARRAAVEKLAQGMGGKVETFYFAFGEADAYVIVDLPDNAAAAAVSLAVGKSGAASVRTIALLTTEELDEATKRTADYRPPGG